MDLKGIQTLHSLLRVFGHNLFSLVGQAAELKFGPLPVI